MEGAFAFRSTRKRGAILITKGPIKVTDTNRELAFSSYFKKHHDAWVKFAQDKGHNVSLRDIILVTGHDTTREYAMAAFANNSEDLRLQFKVGYKALAAASASIWGSWEASPLVHRTCGPSNLSSRDNGSQNPSPITPQDSQIDVTNETTTEDSNQCIFIRGFHMRKRLRGIWPLGVVRAAAGPSDSDIDDRELTPIPIQDGRTCV